MVGWRRGPSSGLRRRLDTDPAVHRRRLWWSLMSESGTLGCGRPARWDAAPSAQFHVKHWDFAYPTQAGGVRPKRWLWPALLHVEQGLSPNRPRRIDIHRRGPSLGRSSARQAKPRLAPRDDGCRGVLSGRTIRAAFAPPVDLRCVSTTPAKRAPGMLRAGNRAGRLPLCSGDWNSLSSDPTLALRLPDARHNTAPTQLQSLPGPPPGP